MFGDILDDHLFGEGGDDAVPGRLFDLQAAAGNVVITPSMTSEGVGLLVWSPLAGGFLSGKFEREGKGPQDAETFLRGAPVAAGTKLG